jgi:ubiquinone biosynthesis monooxygenase Coq7
VIELNSHLGVEASSGGGKLVLWMGDPFDYTSPFRGALAQITEALGPESVRSLQVPPPEQFEDFVEGCFRFDGKLIEVYWEHSLGHMSLRVGDMGTLHDVANRIRPLVVTSRTSRSLNERQRLIRRILRVNHAGEHGAVSIYSAQMLHMGPRHDDLRRWLADTLEHERAHRASFRQAMPLRSARPCRALGVWRIGGWVLGCVTALLGRAGVLACTAAVERTVHGHLQEQIAFLTRHDIELAGLVAQIQREELGHLAYAESDPAFRRAPVRLLSPLIASATELLIAVSTRGDSIRLRRALRAEA